MERKYSFLFDLDSTITRQEILPLISEKVNQLDKMRKLTEATMNGEIPFKTSFLKRVDILKSIKVSEVRKIVENISLNENIANFIINNSECCFVITGNLNVWIEDLMKKLNIKKDHVLCSKAIVKNDYLVNVETVADKEQIVKKFKGPIVVIGDGDNDSGMASYADIAIGFGGVRNIAPSLLRTIDYAFYDDLKCAEFLYSLSKNMKLDDNNE